MGNYPVSEGKYGDIYQIAKGFTVSKAKTGGWDLTFCYKGERQRKRVNDLQTAIQTAELTATKLGIPLLYSKKDELCTVEKAAKEWITANRNRWANNTLERYQEILKAYIIPSFGNKHIDKITRVQVKTFLSDLMTARSPKTVEVIHAVISGIFTEAIENGYTADNPSAGLLKKILPPKSRRTLTEPDPFSKEDLERFLEMSKKYANNEMGAYYLLRRFYFIKMY